MLTIFEGPDGGGKTTFAHVFGGNVHDHGPYPNETHVTLAAKYVPMINAAHRLPVVGDRSWLAEPVYGRAFRGGENRLPVAFRRMLERAALSVRTVVVLFLPGLETCVSAFLRRRGEEYLDTPMQLREVYEGYLGYLRGNDFVGTPPAFYTDLPVVVADWRKMNPGTIGEMIEAARPPTYGPGGGRPSHDSVLLVGDRPSGPSLGPRHVPFAPLHRSGCSYWLTSELEAHGIRERELCWVNAYTRDGIVQRNLLVRLLSQYAFREVIALGEQADATLRQVGLATHETVEHPQYWKRFRYGEEYPLLAKLKEALR